MCKAIDDMRNEAQTLKAYQVALNLLKRGKETIEEIAEDSGLTIEEVNEIAAEFIDSSGGFIAAPSANRSGRPSCTTAAHVYEDMKGIIPLIIDGGEVGIGIESTIVDMTGSRPCLLRPGIINTAMLEETVGDIDVDPSIGGVTDPDSHPKAPGMKYKHYAPKAEVTLVQGDTRHFIAYLLKNQGEGVYALVFDSDMEYCEKAGILAVPYGDTDEQRAAAFFARLRELDDRGAKAIFVRAPRTDGVGLAVYNRLIRAAGYHVVNTQ